MMELIIEELAEACKGKIRQRGSRRTVTGVSIDSRTTQKDMLFIALKGESFDGHDFIAAAYEKAIAAIIVNTNKKVNYSPLKDIYIIEVEDTEAALKEISRGYREKYQIPFIGVTGSVGKTTTKDMIASVLSYKIEVLKNLGNFNNQIGLPLTLFQLESKHQAAVLEMGMSSFGEIEALAKIVTPKIGVITNIGLSHIEHLGSKHGILKAKMEIASQMSSDCLLLLNGDDEYLAAMRREDSAYKKVFFGMKEDNDIIAENITNLGIEGFTFDVRIGGSKHFYRLGYPGIHNVYNALAAIWIGIAFDMTHEEIQQALNCFMPSKMRMEMVNLKEIKIINDAYNASPDSMKAALGVLNSFADGKKIAVLGNMFEMGSFSEVAHRSVGDFIADSTEVDILITVGDMAKWIAEEALEKGIKKLKIYILKNNEEAISTLQEIIEPKDTILIKGSRGMKMEEIVKYLQERS